MKDVIIVGTGGHAKVVADIVVKSGDNLKGFLTGDATVTSFLGKEVLGKEDDFIKFPDCYFIIAIGNKAVRERLSKSMSTARFYTACHPNAVISDIDVEVGEGSVVCAGAVINPSAKIGKHAIINTCAVVDHDNVIGDFVHLYQGAVLGGCVNVGNGTLIGVGASVKPCVKIPADCNIEAGCTVLENIAE